MPKFKTGPKGEMTQNGKLKDERVKTLNHDTNEIWQEYWRSTASPDEYLRRDLPFSDHPCTGCTRGLAATLVPKGVERTGGRGLSAAAPGNLVYVCVYMFPYA